MLQYDPSDYIKHIQISKHIYQKKKINKYKYKSRERLRQNYKWVMMMQLRELVKSLASGEMREKSGYLR